MICWLEWVALVVVQVEVEVVAQILRSISTRGSRVEALLMTGATTTASMSRAPNLEEPPHERSR